MPGKKPIKNNAIVQSRSQEDQASHGHWLVALYTLILFLWAAAAAQAQGVVASPTEVSFESKSESVTVSLTFNGKPIPARDIHGHQLYVGPNTYAEMLQLSKDDGKVTLTPTEYLQVGSYDLVISTRRGEARVRVHSPLTKMPDSLENRAAALGITVEELKEQMGVANHTLRSTITLQIPPSYYVGDTLTLNMPAEAGGSRLVYSWTVNGALVHEGNVFSHTFFSPGAYTIEVVARSLSGATVGRASAGTVVSELPEGAVRRPQAPSVSPSVERLRSSAEGEDAAESDPELAEAGDSGIEVLPAATAMEAQAVEPAFDPVVETTRLSYDPAAVSSAAATAPVEEVTAEAQAVAEAEGADEFVAAVSQQETEMLAEDALEPLGNVEIADAREPSIPADAASEQTAEIAAAPASTGVITPEGTAQAAPAPPAISTAPTGFSTSGTIITSPGDITHSITHTSTRARR